MWFQAADGCNEIIVLARGQNAAMAGLGPLGEFDLYHADAFQGRRVAEFLCGEGSVDVATAEVTSPYLPDQITSVLAVELRQATFTGILIETTNGCAAVQRPYGVSAERAEAHRRDIQQRGLVRMLAVCAANAHARVVVDVFDVHCANGVADPLIAIAASVNARAERHAGQVAFGALVDDRAKHALDRRAVHVRFQQVLAYEGPQVLHGPACAGHEREVASQGVPGLQHVVKPKTERAKCQRKKQPCPRGVEARNIQNDKNQAVDNEKSQVHNDYLCFAKTPPESTQKQRQGPLTGLELAIRVKKGATQEGGRGVAPWGGSYWHPVADSRHRSGC